MKTFSILYWPRKTSGNADYQLTRKAINSATGAMPSVLTKDISIADILAQNPGAVIYYPVFCESTGWWGELLDGNAVVVGKVIISPECQLMVIQASNLAPKRKSGQNQLLAAEIYPTSGFFKKMTSQIATVADMLATDTGTILALFSGKSRSRFIDTLESTGNLYLGCIGGY